MAHLGQQIEVLIREVQSLRSEGQQLRSLVEDLVRGESVAKSQTVSSDLSLVMCMQKDDPLLAIQQRNQQIRRDSKKKQ